MLKEYFYYYLVLNFRFNEDCGFSCCNYREHQTHFHCMRKDCNYRFCDKTRFVQHTARHERLDTLCGTEFEGFRGVPCGRQNCELNALHARRKSIILTSDILGTRNLKFRVLEVQASGFTSFSHFKSVNFESANTLWKCESKAMLPMFCPIFQFFAHSATAKKSLKFDR